MLAGKASDGSSTTHGTQQQAAHHEALEGAEDVGQLPARHVCGQVGHRDAWGHCVLVAVHAWHGPQLQPIGLHTTEPFSCWLSSCINRSHGCCRAATLHSGHFSLCEMGKAMCASGGNPHAVHTQCQHARASDARAHDRSVSYPQLQNAHLGLAVGVVLLLGGHARLVLFLGLLAHSQGRTCTRAARPSSPTIDLPCGCMQRPRDAQCHKQAAALPGFADSSVHLCTL